MALRLRFLSALVMSCYGPVLAAATGAGGDTPASGPDAAAATAMPPAIGISNVLQMFSALLVVVLAIVVMAWLMRRFNRLGGGSGASLKVLASVSLGQRERAVLVQVGAQQLLLGVGQGNVRTLLVLEEPIALNGTATAGAFAEKLAKALKGDKIDG